MFRRLLSNGVKLVHGLFFFALGIKMYASSVRFASRKNAIHHDGKAFFSPNNFANFDGQPKGKTDGKFDLVACMRAISKMSLL